MADERDPLQDMADQFKEMHESLDKIAESSEQMAKNTEPVAKVAKKEISHAHRPNVPTPKVDLDKKTKGDILAALKSIRSQIVVTQHRESTMSDVAADALASGKGLAGAAKEAISFKKEKLKASFKRKFDPLNIVHRMTGGSKLATVLAGKVMGRSEQAIRGAAGLQQLAPSPTPFMGDQGAAPSPVQSDQATGLLEKMAGTLAQILEHMQRNDMIEQARGMKDTGLLERQTDALEKTHDEAEDAAAVTKASAKKGTATQVTKKDDGKKVEEKGDSLFDMLLKGLFSPMGLAIAGLITAGALLYSQWDKLKLSFSLMGDTIRDLWQSIKDGLSSIQTWVTESLTSAYDAVIDAGESLVDGLKSTFGFGKSAEEKQEDLKKRAAAGEGYAQRKLDRQAAEFVSPQATVRSTVEKFTSDSTGRLKGVPQEKLAAEAEKLRSGDYKQAAIGALTKGESISGSPERVAVGGALTQMVGKSYRDMYKVAPLDDTQEQREKRLPSLVEAASVKLAETITSPNATLTPTSTPLATAPTEMPASGSTSGQTLSQANDIKQGAAIGAGAQASGGGNTIINNVKNNNTSSSTVHQPMSPARSEESSYLHSRDRHFAPA